MSGSSDTNLNQQLQRGQGDGNRRQSTGQGPGWDLSQHRQAMQRDIAAAQYA